MRYVLMAAAALAVSGFIALTPARAQMHEVGGPIQSGNMCWISMDGIGGVFGYWKECPGPAKAAKKMKKKKK